jgi:hypothetical protein
MGTGKRMSMIPLGTAEAYLMHHQPGRWRDQEQRDEEGAGGRALHVEAAYQLLRDGWTEIEICIDLRRQYQVTAAGARRAYSKALELLVEEQRRQSQNAPALISAMRWKAIRTAVSSGQVAAAASLLRDAGAVAGEVAAAGLPDALTELKVEVMAPGPYGPSPSQASPSSSSPFQEEADDVEAPNGQRFLPEAI